MCLIKRHLIMSLATGGYSGYLPYAPGTWGSLVGLLLSYWLASLSLLPYLAVCGGCIVIGIWVAGEAERLLASKDAAPIVIDEIAGMLLTYCAVPMSLPAVVLGFIGFRALDIYKPWPQLERLPGGWGIMSDDLMAGILAQGGLRLVLAVCYP